MADIFGADKKVHGADKIVMSSGVKVSFDDDVKLAQSVDLQYQRQVQPVYELGSEDIWVSLTPASGTCNMSRVVGEDDPYEFVNGDKCDGYDITLDEGESTCSKELSTVTATGCHTISCGLQAQAGQGFLTENMQAFVGMIKD